MEPIQRELDSPTYKNIGISLRTQDNVRDYSLKDLLDTSKPVVYRKFNWFQRNITRRNEYRKSQEELSFRKAALEELKERYQYANHLSELNLDFKTACELLKANNIPIVLSEDDKKLENIGMADRKGFDEYVLVHKTQYPPNNDRIQSVKEAQIFGSDTITLSGQEYRYSFQKERDTVHFAVNGEVEEHLYGNNWDQSKYIVLIPLKDIPKETIGAANEVDTFTNGGVNLTTDTVILCPESEVEKINKSNKKAMVVGYEGENARGYGNAMVPILGCLRQGIENWEWNSENASKEFRNLMEANGINTLHHTYTKEAYEENARTANNALSALLNVLKSNRDLLTQKENYDSAYEKIDSLIRRSQRGLNNMQNPNIEMDRAQSFEYDMRIMLKYMEEAGVGLTDEARKDILASVQDANGKPSVPFHEYTHIISSKLLEQTMNEDEQPEIEKKERDDA